MLPIQPLASSVGGGHVQVQRREALRAKSAFYRELLARRHDAYAGSEALPLPAEDRPPQDAPHNEQFVRATMTLPGGVSVTLERTDSDNETTTSVAVTRRNNAVRRAAPQPRRLDIRV